MSNRRNRVRLRHGMIDLLSGPVLSSIGSVTTESLLHGQSASLRVSARREFPLTEFYPNLTLRNGVVGHQHEWIELAVVLRGTPSVVINDVVYAGRPGDWFVFKPNTFHNEFAAPDESPYVLLWFMPQGKMRLHKTCFNSRRRYFLDSVTPLPGSLTDLYRELHDLGRVGNRPLVANKIGMARLVIWCVERLTLGAVESVGEKQVHPAVRQAKAMLMGSIARPPSVKELSRELKISPNYLSSLFQRDIGQTISQFMQALRVEEASIALANASLSIKNIAYALGYADPQHFSHAFHRYKGMSPTRYRQRVLGVPPAGADPAEAAAAENPRIRPRVAETLRAS